MINNIKYNIKGSKLTLTEVTCINKVLTEEAYKYPSTLSSQVNPLPVCIL